MSDLRFPAGPQPTLQQRLSLAKALQCPRTMSSAEEEELAALGWAERSQAGVRLTRTGVDSLASPLWGLGWTLDSASIAGRA